MKRLAICVTVGVLVISGALRAPNAVAGTNMVLTGPSACAEPDSSSNFLLDHFKGLMTATSAMADTMRTMSALTVVDTSLISLVSDTALCRRALGMYAAASGDTSATAVYLIRIGNGRYVASGAGTQHGRDLLVTGDTAFTKIASVLQ